MYAADRPRAGEWKAECSPTPGTTTILPPGLSYCIDQGLEIFWHVVKLIRIPAAQNDMYCDQVRQVGSQESDGSCGLRSLVAEQL